MKNYVKEYSDERKARHINRRTDTHVKNSRKQKKDYASSHPCIHASSISRLLPLNRLTKSARALRKADPATYKKKGVSEMITKREISTISYNTEEYLQRILNDKIEEQEIVFWSYIKHYPECDETKEHLHVYIEPNQKICTDILRKELEEYNTANEKPLGVMPFRTSKFQDWYLYSTHNVNYLRSKCLKREFIYEKSDVVSSDTEYLTELTHLIDYSKINRMSDIIEEMKHRTFQDICYNGQIPIQQILQYKELYVNIQKMIGDKDNDN